VKFENPKMLANFHTECHKGIWPAKRLVIPAISAGVLETIGDHRMTEVSVVNWHKNDCVERQ